MCYIINGLIIIINVFNLFILFLCLLSVYGGFVCVYDYGGRLKRFEGFYAFELIEGDFEIFEVLNLIGWDVFMLLLWVIGSVMLKMFVIVMVGFLFFMDVGIFIVRGLFAFNSFKGFENFCLVRKLELDFEYELWLFGECGLINVIVMLLV